MIGITQSVGLYLHRGMLALLAIIPLGLIGRTIEQEIRANGHPDIGCSWFGLLYFVLIPLELYLGVLWFILYLLLNSKVRDPIRLPAFLLILLLGAIPGIAGLWALFFN